MDIAIAIARQFVKYWLEKAVDSLFKFIQTGEVKEGTEVGVQGGGDEEMGWGGEEIGWGDWEMGLGGE